MRETVLSFLLLSLWGGAATLGAWAVTTVLRRFHTPSRLLCWLWLAVGVRFALPWGIPLILPRPRNENLAQAAETVQTLAETPAPAALPAAPAPAVAAAAAAPWYTGLTVWHLLAAVWAVGVLVLAVRGVAGYLRLRHTVALACRADDGSYSGACVPVPFTLGIFRPRIYLPANLSGRTRRAVLLHEQTHLRRHDPQVKPLFYAVVCLHWFNPLAWLAFRQMEREMESACDEAAVRDCDQAARSAYCESILQYALQGRMAPGSLAFGQGSVKKRIVHLLQYRSIGAGALLVCVAAVGLSVTACMMKPQVEEASTPEAAESAPVEATAETPDTPETAVTFTANTAGLPNLNDPENSPRFLCPVEYSHISRYEGNSHRGDDLIADTGTPVYAAQDGVVLTAESNYSYGNLVILDHGTGLDGNRWTTRYAHMDDYTVQAGQTVKAGDLIGHVGNTGNSTGPHLHFELTLNGLVTQPRYFTAYRAEDTEPLNDDTVQALREQAVRNTALFDLYDVYNVLQQQQTTLTDQKEALQAQLADPSSGQSAGEIQQQIDDIDVSLQEVQTRLEETMQKIEAQNAQEDVAQLQQQIEAAQSAGNTGSDPALQAGEDAARQQMDAASEQLNSYLASDPSQNG